MSRKRMFPLIKKYFPKATDKECDFILHEKTTFPLEDDETIEKQIKDYHQKIGGKRQWN